MNKVLTVIARTEAKENKIHLVKTALLKLIEPTRKEQGCLRYDLLQDNKNPKVFLMYQNWQSHELWQKHMKNEQVKSYRQETKGAVHFLAHSEISQIA